MASAPTETPCKQELAEAYMCLEVTGPVACDCFDSSTFTTEFEQQTRESFLSTQAFASPLDSGFCGAASDRVCDYYNTNQSCCCQFETDIYRKCLVGNVFSQDINVLAQPCENSCAVQAGDDSGGGSSAVIIAIVGLVGLIGAAVGGYFYCRRRRQRAPAGDKPVGEKKGLFFSFGGGKSQKKDKKKNKSKGKIDTTHSKEEISSGGEQDDIEKGQPRDEDSDSGSEFSDYLEDNKKKQNTRPEEIAYESSRAVPKKMSSKAALASQESIPDGDNGVSKAAQLKKKRHAIESWNSQKKQGSNRSLESFLVEEPEPIFDPLTEDVKKNSKGRSSSKRGLATEQSDERRASPEQLRSINQYEQQLQAMHMEKEADMRKMHELAKDREEAAQRLSQVEDKKGYYEGRLKAAKDEAESLRMDRLNAAKRIAELEAQNMQLNSKLQRSSSSRGLTDGDELKERPSRMKRASSKNRLEAEEPTEERRMKRSSSKNHVEAEETTEERRMKRSSSKNRQETDEEKQERRMKRSSSKNRLETDEEKQGRRMKRSSSKNRLETNEEKKERRMKRSGSDRGLNPSQHKSRERKSSRNLEKSGSGRGLSSKVDDLTTS